MLKKILIIIPAIVILIILLVIFLYWQTDVVSDFTRLLLNKNLRDVATIDYQSLSGDLFDDIILRELTISLHNGLQVHANDLRINYDIFDVIRGQYMFSRIAVDSLWVVAASAGTENAVQNELNAEPAEEERTLQETLNQIASAVPLKELIDGLPILALENLTIGWGRIELRPLNRIFEDIRLTMSAFHLDNRVDLEISRLQAAEKQSGFQLNQLRVQIIGNDKRLTLNRLEVQTPRSRVFAHADLTIGDSLWVIMRIEDSHLSMQDITPFIERPVGDSAEIGISFSLVGQPNRFSATLHSSGYLNEYKLDSLVLDADYRKGTVNLRRASLALDTSRIDIKGNIYPGNNRLSMKFRHFNLGMLPLDLIKTDLNGNLTIHTTKLQDPLAFSEGRINLYHSFFDTVQIDTLRFAVRAGQHRLSILQPSYLRLGEGSVFTVSGSLDSLNNLNFVLATEKNNLQILTAATGLPAVAGEADANLFLNGPLSNPDLEAYLWLPHLDKDKFFLDTLIAQVNIKKIISGRHGHAFLTAAHWEYGDLDITQTMTNFIFDSNRVVLDTLLFAKNDNYFSSTGVLEANDDTVDITFNFFRINYQQTWIENRSPLVFTLTPEEYNIESAVFIGPDEGTIEIRGYWDRLKDDMQFGLYIQDFSFAPLKQFMKKDQNFAGKLNADFVLVNPLKDLQIDMTLQAEDLMINQVPVGDVRCIFQYEKNKLFIDEFEMSNGQAMLEVDGDVALAWTDSSSSGTPGLINQSLADVKVIWKNLRLEDYAPLLNLSRPLKGNISGQMNLAGTFNRPRGKLELKGRKLLYDKFMSDSLSISGHFNRDSLVLDHFGLDLNGTDFEGGGWQLINFNLASIDSIIQDRPFELAVTSQGDRITFLGNILEQVERLEGAFEASFLLSGTWQKASLVKGYFKMDDGRLLLSRIRNPITNVEIDATIDSSMMVIHSVSGYASKETDFWEDAYSVVKRFFRLFTGETSREGTMSGEGTIDLSNIYHPRFDLDLNTYFLYLDYFVENTNFVISTDNLHVQGGDTISVTGDITIDEGAYLVDVDKLKKNIYLSRPTLKEPRPLVWNLSLNIPGNFIISSSKLDLLNNFSFEIMGNFRSIQEVNEASMELTGHMEIISGKYGSWGQNFTIASGSISLNDPKVINPDINIRAEKKSGDYFVEIILSGTLDELNREVQVRSSDGTYLTNLSDQEILGLVSLGQRQIDLAGAGGQVISTSVETALERGAEALTGLDKVEIGSGSGGSLIDMQSMKLNRGIENASVSLGKYLSSNLYMEYTGVFGSNAVPTPSLNWRPGNQIGLEYRINKNWSVDSHYTHTLRGNNIYRIALAWKMTF